MSVDDRVNLQKALYTISHEFKNDIITLQGLITILAQKYEKTWDEDDKENIDLLFESIKHQESYIQSLLDYSRVNTRGRPSSIKSIQELIAIALKSINNEQVKIECNCNTKLKLDNAQFTKALSCIIINSIQYSNCNPVIINFNCDSKENDYILKIKDNGTGIDDKFKDQIFSVFSPGKNSVSGIGMGLATVKKIVERQGGSISYDFSTKEFIIILPIALCYQDV
jgi:light-regulated signal transduction histidine kinase (bacteriophytochrome)